MNSNEYAGGDLKSLTIEMKTQNTLQYTHIRLMLACIQQKYFILCHTPEHNRNPL